MVRRWRNGVHQKNDKRKCPIFFTGSLVHESGFQKRQSASADNTSQKPQNAGIQNYRYGARAENKQDFGLDFYSERK